MRKSGIDACSVQVAAGRGREAIWGAEGTSGLEAVVLQDGDLVGFVHRLGRDPGVRPDPPGYVVAISLRRPSRLV